MSKTIWTENEDRKRELERELGRLTAQIQIKEAEVERLRARFRQVWAELQKL
jgi:predicted nuclease with TOPRIM domain